MPATSEKYREDIAAVLATRGGNGGEFWASADGRIGVGTPFSTLEAPLILHELGVGRRHEAVRGAVGLILDAVRDDGRCRVAPQGAIYPCHTANAARVACRFGYARDPRLKRLFTHLLERSHDDGGWRCLKFSGGRGPETGFSNPGVTLFALDALRHTAHVNRNPALDRAVGSLLDHWAVRRPIGPCHFGIGTLFMQVEYPFLRYNLFDYVYVLSFYDRAKRDRRFREAFELLEAKLDGRGRLIVERPHRKLAGLSLCRRGEPSGPGTRRFREIVRNISKRGVT